MKYKNLAGTIDIPCYINYSKIALDIYGYLNPQNFYETIVIEKFMEDSLREIYKIHKQEYTPIIKSYVYNPIFTIEDKVLLAFSAGLDSMYQAFKLRDKGFNVILFHCKNMNYYSNGKEYEACINFINKYNFPLVECNIKANNKKDNRNINDYNCRTVRNNVDVCRKSYIIYIMFNHKYILYRKIDTRRIYKTDGGFAPDSDAVAVQRSSSFRNFLSYQQYGTSSNNRINNRSCHIYNNSLYIKI